MSVNKCITVAESEQPAKIDYLRKSNFLNEFDTAQDKARARRALGIPENASFYWGDLKGVPSENSLLTQYVSSRIQTALNDFNTNGNGEKYTSIIEGLCSSYQEIVNQLSGIESVGDLAATINELKEKVYSNIANTAQNSVKILELMQGGITPGQQYDVQALLQRVEAVESRAQALESSRVTNSYLEGKLLEYQKLITDLDIIRTKALTTDDHEYRISSLERLVGEDMLNEQLFFPQASISGTENGSATLTIKAVYSKSGHHIVTEDPNLHCNSENHTIAVWNTETYKIDLLSPGTTTLNFEYTDSKNNTATGSVTVIVNAEQQELPKQYVGCGSTATEIIEAPSSYGFQYNTVGGTWTKDGAQNTNIINVYPGRTLFNLYIITTQSIRDITDAMGSLGLSPKTSMMINEVVYSVYEIPGLNSTDFDFTITLN